MNLYNLELNLYMITYYHLYDLVTGFLGSINWALFIARICQLYPNALPSITGKDERKQKTERTEIETYSITDMSSSPVTFRLQIQVAQYTHSFSENEIREKDWIFPYLETIRSRKWTPTAVGERAPRVRPSHYVPPVPVVLPVKKGRIPQ
ncbi:hypothetical protein M9H77_08296 [Catharanthus roseus]|uniref:Uncharacterized protein n=1 Tax=Catharanthus roseus TaxID=4058 RepID=A0ACC0BXI3_CATRO|nr:hypothetical protein M9H77_08296 [Catharanthus roseus]